MTAKLKDLRQPGPIAVPYEGLTRREMARLDAPMTTVHGPRCVLPVAQGRARKNQRHIGPQLRLVVFDAHALIPALVHNRLRDVALGQERIHRDQPPFPDQLLSESPDGRDRIGFVVNGVLGSCHAYLVRQRR
jgi:hypothetical protein